MNIDKNNMGVLRDKIDAALKLIAEENDLDISLGRGSYERDGTNGSFKLNISRIDDGNVLTREALAWGEVAEEHGFKKEDLFTIMPNGHRIIGWNTRASKNPIQTERDGKIYIWRVASIKNAMRIK